MDNMAVGGLSPRGWFAVAFEEDIPVLSVRPLRFFSDEYVLFRTAEGRLGILDSTCPHLGGHLGYGKVDRNGVSCPFHGWAFDVNGACIRGPHSGGIPGGARVRAWPNCLVGGFAWMYHGDPVSGRVDELADMIGLSIFCDLGCRIHTVKARIQDIGENFADFSHFAFVHSIPLMSWEYAEEGDHFTVAYRASMPENAFLGRSVPVTIVSKSTCSGLGAIVTITKLNDLAEFRVITAATPIDCDVLELRVRYSIRWCESIDLTVGMQIGTAGVREMDEQLKRDIAIWNHRRYVARPLLTASDRCLAQYRTWARRFFVAGQGVGQE